MRDYYEKPEKPASPHVAANMIDEVLELASCAGVKLPELAAPREKIDNADQFKRAYSNRRFKDTSAATLDIARRIVDGEIELDAAAEEAALAQQWASGSILAHAVSRSEELAARRGWAEASEVVDGEKALKAARSSAEKALKEIHELRPILEGIVSADEAAAAGAEAASAWAAYKELLPRWEATHDFVSRMRRYHWVSPLSPDLRFYSKFGRPDIRSQDRKENPEPRNQRERDEHPPIVLLLDPRCDAWEPGPPRTETEARRAQEVVAQAERNRSVRDRRHRAAIGVAPVPGSVG